MSELSTKAAALLDYCKENGRVCPEYEEWQHVWEMLQQRKQEPSEGWEPSPPPPLNRGIATDLAKMSRLREHIEWADKADKEDKKGKRDVTGKVDEYLRRLTEAQWFHGCDMPEILTRLLDDDTRAAASEGEKANFILGCHAVVARKFGSPDWDYWLPLPFWTARDVACLLVELNPDRYDMVATAINPQIRTLAEHVADIERKALREQQAGKLCEKPSPQQWAAWAWRSGYALPDRLQSVYAQTGESSPEVTRTDEAGKAGADEAAAAMPDIPGKLPPVACGKLAVTAAWQIECESTRVATADKVMECLQRWADDGTYPDVLLRSDKKNRAVIWRRKKSGLGKPYDIDACGKTLQTWMESRE